MKYRLVAGGICASLLLNACATEGINPATGQPITEVQRAQQNCKVMIGMAALLGAAGGAAASRRNPGSGAAIGGAAGGLVGAGFCAVMLATANEKDRAHIAEAQRLAFESGRAQRQQWTGDDGKLRVIRVTTQDVAVTSVGLKVSEFDYCRKRNTDLTVQGAGDGQTNELICHKPDGTITIKRV